LCDQRFNLDHEADAGRQACYSEANGVGHEEGVQVPEASHNSVVYEGIAGEIDRLVCDLEPLQPLVADPRDKDFLQSLSIFPSEKEQANKSENK
jgi:hypothetical protein